MQIHIFHYFFSDLGKDFLQTIFKLRRQSCMICRKVKDENADRCCGIAFLGVFL